MDIVGRLMAEIQLRVRAPLTVQLAQREDGRSAQIGDLLVICVLDGYPVAPSAGKVGIEIEASIGHEGFSNVLTWSLYAPSGDGWVAAALRELDRSLQEALTDFVEDDEDSEEYTPRPEDDAMIRRLKIEYTGPLFS